MAVWRGARAACRRPRLSGANPDAMHVDNFPLSEITKAALKKRGIETLFDIQANVLKRLEAAAWKSTARAAPARRSASLTHHRAC